MPNEDLETRILELLQPFAAQLAEVLRTEALAEARREIRSLLDGGSPTPTAHAVAPTPASASKPRRNGAEAKRHLPSHCVYPDCRKTHKGPRFSFMCEDHIGTPKRDKAKYLLDWKATHSA